MTFVDVEIEEPQDDGHIHHFDFFEISQLLAVVTVIVASSIEQDFSTHSIHEVYDDAVNVISSVTLVV